MEDAKIGKGKSKQPRQGHCYESEIHNQLRSQQEWAGRVLKSILPKEYSQAGQVGAQKNIYSSEENSKSPVKERPM